MAYTILKSDGTLLTTIADGTINTTSTSLGLPGRNYAGYGQPMDTNFVHMLENFSDTVPPDNPLQGQLWFDTNTNTLRLCPADGTTLASEWYTLTSTGNTGITTFNDIVVLGNASIGNHVSIGNDLNVANILCINLDATANANLATANIGNTITRVITTGGATITGAITGNWTFTSGSTVNSPTANIVNLTLTNANVTGNANIANTITRVITTGAAATTGNITGTWTLTTGSTLQATYADLAERFEADEALEPGTVVELGGSKEIRAVRYELSDDVFGVISNTAAYLMNSQAGSNDTHPAVAVSGRVQVKVKGPVSKGQRLVSAGKGIARAAQQGEATAFNTIGRALEDKTSVDLGTVLAIVMIK